MLELRCSVGGEFVNDTEQQLLLLQVDSQFDSIS